MPDEPEQAYNAGSLCVYNATNPNVEDCLIEGSSAVGSHWFQYRDQPLVGRGDGENYQIGFVDVCDRPYPALIRAVREVGERMYEVRSLTGQGIL